MESRRKFAIRCVEERRQAELFYLCGARDAAATAASPVLSFGVSERRTKLPSSRPAAGQDRNDGTRGGPVTERPRTQNRPAGHRAGFLVGNRWPVLGWRPLVEQDQLRMHPQRHLHLFRLRTRPFVALSNEIRTHLERRPESNLFDQFSNQGSTERAIPLGHFDKSAAASNDVCAVIMFDVD